MDTTITTIGNCLVLLGENPEQYAKLREDPTLASSAMAEVIRLRTPAPVFGRKALADVEVAGTLIPAGSQVALCYGSANMDPRKFAHPEIFDVTRNPVDHLGFGYGVHGCAGQGLAKLEIQALLLAMTQHVESFAIGEVASRLNNFTRPYASIEVTGIVPARG